jgi:hypothetical protein
MAHSFRPGPSGPEQEPSGAPNLLLRRVDYRLENTRFGTWSRFLYSSGASYAEFRSHAVLFGLPLLHYTAGICPETGRRRTARGIVAVGRRAIGLLAVGQAALGVIAVGQLAVGLVFGFGQAATGLVALGQVALGGLWGVGQVAAAYVAVGQIGAGEWVLAQLGMGTHRWTPKHADPAAVEYFRALWGQVRAYLPWPPAA